MNKRLPFYIISLGASIIMSGIIVNIFIRNNPDYFIIGLSIILFGILFQIYFTSKEPIPHNVAVIGLEKSGKTTLITTLFSEIFAQRIIGINATIKGKSTIEKLNSDISRLEKGKSLSPTRDQDIFAYRTSIRLNKFPSRDYTVEIGDFSGKYSKKYGEEHGSSSHTSDFFASEYFRWVLGSDAYIFIIDLGRYLPVQRRKNYISNISAFIRRSWQETLNVTEDGPRKLKNRPVVLVFTKADLFGVEEPMMDKENLKYDQIGKDYYKQMGDPGGLLEQKIIELAYGSRVPPIRDININALEKGKKSVLLDFKDLTNYLNGETKYFNILFTSCFGLEKGRRLGIESLLKYIMPR